MPRNGKLVRISLVAAAAAAIAVVAVVTAGTASAKSTSGSVTGAGSTFVAPLVAKWQSAVQQQLGLQLNYNAVGSGGGVSAITNKQVDFGASDAPLSQFSPTWLMLAVDPRSTWSHCGSPNALDQRVPVLPSVALDAGKLAFSVDDAVVGLPWDSSVAAACAGPPPMMTRYAASRSAATAAMAAGSGVRRRVGPEWVTVIGYSDAD